MNINAAAMRDVLRTKHSEDLDRRRKVIGLSGLGLIDFSIISLYQTGVIKSLPDIPHPLFDSDKVNASEDAYRFGTLWGLARGALDLAGVSGGPATLVHWAALWGTEMIMLPAIDVAPPVKEWGVKQISKDAMHHIIYAIAAGAVYDAIE